MHVTPDTLAKFYRHIRTDDRVKVDRAQAARPGSLIVVTLEGERRLGLFVIRDGRAVLDTTNERLPLTADAEYFGTVDAAIHVLRRRGDSTESPPVAEVGE